MWSSDRITPGHSRGQLGGMAKFGTELPGQQPWQAVHFSGNSDAEGSGGCGFLDQIVIQLADSFLKEGLSVNPPTIVHFPGRGRPCAGDLEWLKKDTKLPSGSPQSRQ